MKRIIISTLLLMLMTQVSIGQTLKTYSGLYEGGQATYTYYEDENGGRVKHGKFTYNKSDKGVGVERGMNIPYTKILSASGNYKNGVKDGMWTYEDKTDGGKIKFAGFSAIINYVNGRMEGTLVHEGAMSQMKNNRITGPVKKTKKTLNEDWTLSGQFDDDGFPDGNWKKDYKLNGNLYVDTEKYVHGLLVAKQTQNVSTGKITRHEFPDVNPQDYVAAYNPAKDSTIVGELICQEKIYYEQGENNESSIDRLPEVFGAEIRSIAEKIKNESGFGSEQEKYEGIPFKKIVIVDKMGTQDEDIIYTMVEKMPEFPGGMFQLLKYITKNLKASDQESDIRGRVIVRFVVNRDGSISGAKIVRGIDPTYYDKEVLRLVNSMPRWIPGQQNGKNVRVQYTLPIRIDFQ